MELELGTNYLELELGTNYLELESGTNYLELELKTNYLELVEDKLLGIRVEDKLLGIIVGDKLLGTRVGDKFLGIRVNLSPKRNCGSTRVKTTPPPGMNFLAGFLQNDLGGEHTTKVVALTRKSASSFSAREGMLAYALLVHVMR